MKQQPHFILGPSLRQSIEKLKADAREINSKPPTQPTKPVSLIDRYVVQVKTWVSSLTSLQRQRAYTLEELIALVQLKGHFRDRASNQFTGEALRQSGFTSQRNWTRSGRNKRYWRLSKKETT